MKNEYSIVWHNNNSTGKASVYFGHCAPGSPRFRPNNPHAGQRSGGIHKFSGNYCSYITAKRRYILPLAVASNAAPGGSAAPAATLEILPAGDAARRPAAGVANARFSYPTPTGPTCWKRYQRRAAGRRGILAKREYCPVNHMGCKNRVAAQRNSSGAVSGA